MIFLWMFKGNIELKSILLQHYNYLSILYAYLCTRIEIRERN